VLASRRTPAASGPPPTRNPRRHGAGLNHQLQAVRQTRRLPIGIDPDLVFKVKAANTRLTDEALAPRGLIPLGETADYLYFVMAHDEGSELASALERYLAGADEEGAKGPLYTLFDRVEAIEPYNPEDRRGPGLDDLDPSVQPYVVDVSIWPSEDWDEAQRRSNVVIGVINLTGGVIVHQAIGTRRSVLRVSVNDEGLNNLLDTSVVERVRTPPVPFIDPSDWRDVHVDGLMLRTQRGVAVGILDDEPAAGHPLLTGLIGSVIEVGPAGYSWPAPGNHGTQVASRALLPRLAEELRDHSAITAVGTVHVARILEPVPGRPDETRFACGDAGFPPHEVLQRAITRLQQDCGVRVFNLSFGLREAFDAIHVSELTEVIDELARELDIVVVVPTGNAPVYGRSETGSGHHAQRDYPAYLSAPEHRLAEPGPAALALTVGAVAHSDAPAARPGSARLRDTAIAGIDQLSPFSRTGPGIGASAARLNKPDLVADGGNWVHDGDLDHIIPEDPGVGVITAALGTTGQLFRAACGTSFAAPAVARCAADVLAAYPGSSANLMRALVATSAREPAGAEAISNVTERRRFYGLGRPDSDRATESGSRRVTMIFDGDMAIDTVVNPPNPGARAIRARA
jgi:Subtilase family